MGFIGDDIKSELGFDEAEARAQLDSIVERYGSTKAMKRKQEEALHMKIRAGSWTWYCEVLEPTPPGGLVSILEDEAASRTVQKARMEVL